METSTPSPALLPDVAVPFVINVRVETSPSVLSSESSGRLEAAVRAWAADELRLATSKRDSSIPAPNGNGAHAALPPESLAALTPAQLEDLVRGWVADEVARSNVERQASERAAHPTPPVRVLTPEQRQAYVDICESAGMSDDELSDEQAAEIAKLWQKS